jgi:nitric-oxide synthase
LTLIATNAAVPSPRTDQCPVTHTPPTPCAVDPAEAQEFLTQFHAETEPSVPLARRVWQIRDEIDATGTYAHTSEELAFGARLAWRNAARCIGRLYWKSLYVRDRRDVTSPAAIAAECGEHLRVATRDGRIRSTITVFAPDRPDAPGPRIHNDQLIRYAGHRTPAGDVRGDGKHADFTDRAVALGRAGSTSCRCSSPRATASRRSSRSRPT